MFRTLSFASLLFLLTPPFAVAQDASTGLGRIYIQPLDGSFDKLLGFEIVRQHMPVVIVDSPKSADCVLGWTTVPGMEGRTDFVVIERQTRSVTWEFGTQTTKLNNPKRNARQKVSAQIVHSLAKAGAYCGGAAFSAPSQSADQRVKAFKPPTFNW